MSDSCQCGHDCGCNQKKDVPNVSPEEKVENLKKDIVNLGYLVEDAGEGEIKISEQK